LLVPTFINKTMMVLLLCLIFIGQSMASISMFYTMTNMQSSAQMSTQSMAGMSSMQGMHHMMEEADGSAHDMGTMSTDDCCAQECECSTSGCSTLSAFSTSMTYPPAFAIENKITSPNALTASQTLTSLYRPPILS
jgi:hypothetical protein